MTFMEEVSFAGPPAPAAAAEGGHRELPRGPRGPRSPRALTLPSSAPGAQPGPVRAGGAVARSRPRDPPGLAGPWASGQARLFPSSEREWWPLVPRGPARRETFLAVRLVPGVGTSHLRGSTRRPQRGWRSRLGAPNALADEAEAPRAAAASPRPSPPRHARPPPPEIPGSVCLCLKYQALMSGRSSLVFNKGLSDNRNRQTCLLFVLNSCKSPFV